MERKGAVVLWGRPLLGQRGWGGDVISDGPGGAGMGQHEPLSILPKERSDVRLRLAGESGDVISHHLAVQDPVLGEAERLLPQLLFGLIGKTQAKPFFFRRGAEDEEWRVVHPHVRPVVAETDQIPSVGCPLQPSVPGPGDSRMGHELIVVPKPAVGVESNTASHPRMADPRGHDPMVPRRARTCRESLGGPGHGPYSSPRACRRRRSRARWAAFWRTSARVPAKWSCSTWVGAPGAARPR